MLSSKQTLLHRAFTKETMVLRTEASFRVIALFLALTSSVVYLYAKRGYVSVWVSLAWNMLWRGGGAHV